jgi:hypothetical protein
MEIIVIAKEKLVEKHINWKETYTKKTQYLKDQFEDVVGKGSYFRFEGKNIESGDEYYCIIGPAKIRTPIAKFFAGVRKLPATYSAGGKYFDSLDGAANYAHETWGIPILKEMKPYTSSHLFGIASKVERWKRKRERRKEREESKEGKEKRLKEKESSVVDFSCYRFAMAKPQAYREEIKLSEKMSVESEIFTKEKVEENKGILADNPELESKDNIVGQKLMSDAPVKDNKRLNKAFKDTLMHLIKIAKELDNENKGDAAEEIHKVIRKYQARIF